MSNTPKPPCAGLLPFQGHTVRYVIEMDGTAWLVARDIINILGLDTSRSLGRWLAPLPEEDRPFRLVSTSHGLQQSRVVSLRGAIALAERRKRSIDGQVRAFLMDASTVLGSLTQ